MMFNVDELLADTIETPDDKSGVLVEQYMRMHGERVESIRNLFGRIPESGEIFFLWTVKSFNSFTFIPYILKECDIIEQLIISTYSINIRIINALIKLIDAGKIKQVDLFISESLQSRLPKVYDHLMAVTDNKPVRVIYAWNHSKIALIKTANHYFDLEGSGNFSENAQHEQYIFLNNRKIYEFRKNEILHGIECRTDQTC
jgi:hypothetical protein